MNSELCLHPVPRGRFCRPRIGACTIRASTSPLVFLGGRELAPLLQDSARQDAVADRRILVESHAAQIGNSHRRLAGQARHFGRTVAKAERRHEVLPSPNGSSRATSSVSSNSLRRMKSISGPSRLLTEERSQGAWAAVRAAQADPQFARRGKGARQDRARSASGVSLRCCSATWSDSPSSPTGLIPKRCRPSFAPTRRPARPASPVMRAISSQCWATALSLSSDFRSRTSARPTRRPRRAGHRRDHGATALPRRRPACRFASASRPGWWSSASGERNAVGETMNLASRLQTIANLAPSS